LAVRSSTYNNQQPPPQPEHQVPEGGFRFYVTFFTLWGVSAFS